MDVGRHFSGCELCFAQAMNHSLGLPGNNHAPDT